MHRTHFANTFFEKELESQREHSLVEWIQSHPAILQLQYFPFLYRQKEDSVLLLEPPPPSYLQLLQRHGYSTSRIELLANPHPMDLDLWGPSLAVSKWAEKHGCKADLQDWNRVKEIHSKFFSFASTPQILGSKILQTVDETLDWIASLPGPKVLKRAFGLAGSGHLFLEETLPPRAFSLLENGEALIGEPWVKRTFDFSTQWKIVDQIEYLGATVLETSEKGVYLGTKAGEVERLFKGHERALKEHLEIVRPVLKKISSFGFRGHLGIDSFVYEWKNGKRLRAISEINARKTLGWAALEIHRNAAKGKTLHLRYQKSSEEGFLPNHLGQHLFDRQLFLHWE